MEKRTLSQILPALLLVGMWASTLNIRTVQATQTIYIRADGSIDPPTAPIERSGNIYTLSKNIFSDSDKPAIEVEIDNVILDGHGYKIQGTRPSPGQWQGAGISVIGRTKVIIKNMEINSFVNGIGLGETSSCNIYRNNITENYYGIRLINSSSNTLFGNNLKNNSETIRLEEPSNHNNTIYGNNIAGIGWGNAVALRYSSSNTVYGNNITEGRLVLTFSNNNTVVGNSITSGLMGLGTSSNNVILGNKITASGGNGIALARSSNNSISGNIITASKANGIYLDNGSSNNRIFGNNITSSAEYSIHLHESGHNSVYHNNLERARVLLGSSANSWDDGYPSGGNYWSDYMGIDVESGLGQDQAGSDGIGDTPYVIDADNKDRYPIMSGLASPADITPPIANAGDDHKANVGSTVNFDADASIDNVGIASYEWNFGDGTTGTGKTATHTYGNTGTYTVTLTIEDTAGNTAADQSTITVLSEGLLIDPMLLYVLVVVAIVIGLGAIVFVMRRKKKAPEVATPTQ